MFGCDPVVQGIVETVKAEHRLRGDCIRCRKKCSHEQHHHSAVRRRACRHPYARRQHRTTIYGSDGRAAARSTTDTQGTTTTYDARGNVVTRQSNGTLYGADGRSIGSVQVRWE